MTAHPPSTLNESSSDAWPDALIAMLEEQRSLAGELSELAAGQAQLIDSGQTEALLGLLASRQKLVDRFIAGQEMLGRLTSELEARADELLDDQRERIRTLLDEVTAGLAAVMRQDEQDQELLQAARQDRRKQIEGVDIGKSARNAYIKTNVTSRFADRKG